MKLRVRHLLLLLPAMLVCLITSWVTRISQENMATRIWHLEYAVPLEADPGIREFFQVLQAAFPVDRPERVTTGTWTRESHPALFTALVKEGILMPPGSELEWVLPANWPASEEIVLTVKTSVNDQYRFYALMREMTGGNIMAAAPSGAWRSRSLHVPNQSWGLSLAQNIYWHLKAKPRPTPVIDNKVQFLRPGAPGTAHTLLRLPRFSITTNGLKYKGQPALPLFVLTFLATLFFYLLRRPIARLFSGFRRRQ